MKDSIERSNIYNITAYILFGAEPNKDYIDELRKLDNVEERANQEYDTLLTVLKNTNIDPKLQAKIVKTVNDLTVRMKY